MDAFQAIGTILGSSVLLIGATAGVTVKILAWNASKPKSVPPAATSNVNPAEEDRKRIRAAARAEGFAPGDTETFERMNSMGAMRCNGHAPMMNLVTDAKTAANSAVETAERVEQVVKSEGARTRESVDALAEKFEALLPWKGAHEAKVQRLEQDVNSLFRNRGATSRG